MRTETTPNGTVIDYVEEPKRFYRVNGAEVPSVTTILNCLSKDGLPWWGMTIGAKGIADMVARTSIMGLPRILQDPVQCLKDAKVTVNHVRDKAGARGTLVHDALETLVADGELPDRKVMERKLGEEIGYFDAMLAWYEDAQPEVQDVEVMVGVPGKFAGRYDLRATIPTCELVVRADTGQRATFEAGSYRWDAKTPKGVYPTHLLQLDGYEVGAEACGYSTTDAQAVIRLAKDGTYEVVRNTSEPGSFMSIVAAYEALEGAKPIFPRKARSAA